MNIPHYSQALEADILGHLMYIGTHNDLRAQKAMLKLSRSSFYKVINSELFSIIQECFVNQEPFGFVDVMVLANKGNSVLFEELSYITNSYMAINVSEEKIDYEVKRLLSLERARNNVKLAEDAISQAYHLTDPNDANEVMTDLGKKLCELECVDFSRGFTQQELYEDILSGKADKARIIPTCSMQFNEILGGGVRSKSLITVAGAAGIGKTGFAIWFTDIIARTQPDRQSIFYSLEMDPHEILMRHIGICAGQQYDKLTEPEQIDAIASAFNVPMRIFDFKANDIETILTTSRLLAMEKPISVIVVDYLTLVTNRGNFERNDLRQADTTTKLARLAQELDCIVIALSQVNREAAQGEDQCPMPKHAADSSGSHRSSALWLGIDRPELYIDEPWAKDQFVIKCRKNRYGSNFEYTLSFSEGAFKEVSHGHFHKPEKPKKMSTKEMGSAIFGSPYKPHHG